MTDTATMPETLTERESTPPRIPAEMLPKLLPHVISRWSARIFVCGETRYSESENPFSPGQPLLMRTPASIGKAFAETCVGVPVLYGVRPHDGLRVGTARVKSTRQILHLVAGYIEAAIADDHGILAELIILTGPAHEALVDLASHDALADAMACLNHHVEVTLRRTRWNLLVADVTRARARMLDLTSQGHTPGTRILRRLDLDEPLDERDSAAPSALYVPGMLDASRAVEEAAGAVSVGSVTTSERQTVNTATASVTHSASAGFQISQYTVTHSLNKIVTVSPSLTSISGESSSDRFTGIFQDAVGVNSFVVRVVSTNPNVTISATLKVNYW